MSGCYDYEYDYCNDNYEYYDECKPRRRQKKRHHECWDWAA